MSQGSSDPHLPTNAPHVPSKAEVDNYLYGLPSKPHLITRSNANIWVKPTSPKEYLDPKEMTPLGIHPVSDVWEDVISPAMDCYLVENQVQWSILNPLRIGTAGDPFPSAFILVGINPGTLAAEVGIFALKQGTS